MPAENNDPRQPCGADGTGSVEPGSAGDSAGAGTPVVVRRSAGLATLLGAGASAVAIAYLWRATQTMHPVDWALCGVMAAVAAVYLSALVDSRTPLLVADDLGVRIRLGHDWRGLPWDAIAEVVVEPRRGVFRDGRLMLVPHSLARALDGLDARGRRQASANQKTYGGALAVPIGMTTRVSTADGHDLAGGIEALALGRARVVAPEPSVDGTSEGGAPGEPSNESSPDDGPGPAGPAGPADPADAGGPGRAAAASGTIPVPGAAGAPPAPPVRGATEVAETTEVAQTTAADEPTADGARSARWNVLGGIGTIVSRVAKGRRHDTDRPDGTSQPDGTGRPGDAAERDLAADPPTLDGGARALDPSATAALRSARPALRAEVTRDIPATLGNAALHESLGEPTPESRPVDRIEGRELRRPGSVDLVIEPPGGRVRPISRLGDPVEPLVIDDFVTEPAYDPVIGPELAAARTRLGLSVDDLAERTRIRPHVIESIEVDDFAPCGGDFYARGHLRTLARVLGQDATSLLETFEERYATAPVNARRVFEAELATGMTGSMRSTLGGPNWGLLVGAVLSLVLVWGVVRLFSTEPVEVVPAPTQVVDGAVGGEADTAPRAPLPAAPPVATTPITLVAAHGDSRVLVRDGSGRVVFRGQMVLGERKRLDAEPPVRVRARDGGAIEVRVRKKERGVLGEPGEPARRTFGRSAG